jgi:hypothetical protein
MRLNDSLVERTTAATNVILSLAAAGSVIYLQMRPQEAAWRFSLWSWFFALIALSAAFAAAYHGLTLTEIKRRAFWQILTASLSMAISLFLVGVFYDVCGVDAAGRGLPIMLAAGVLIFGVSRLFPGLFMVFVVYQVLALAIALSAYAGLAASGSLPGAGWMAAGVLFSMIAAGIQTARHVHLRVVWEFDHNGMFHLVQVIGLLLICVGLSEG